MTIKTSDFIKQLQGVLPSLTDSFTESKSITSISNTSGVLTIEPFISGMKVGSFITLRDIKLFNNVTSYSIDGNVATITTDKKHQLTEGYNTSAQLYKTGIETDVDFELLSVIDSNSFTINKGSISDFTDYKLVENTFINGKQYEVSEISESDFKIDTQNTIINSSFDVRNAKIEYGYRIFGVNSSTDINKYLESLTDDNGNVSVQIKPTLFIESRGNTTSQSQTTFDDSIYKINAGQTSRIEKIKTVAVNLTYGIQDDTTGFAGVEFAEDLEVLLDKCLFGLALESNTSDKTKYLIVPISNDPIVNDSGLNAVYEHEFIFQVIYIIQNNTEDGDGVEYETFAFRNFELQYKLKYDDYEDIKKTDEGEL